MKKITIIFLIFWCFNGFSQISRPDILQTGIAIEMGGGAVFSMLPSTVNSIDVSTSEYDYNSFNSFTAGIRGDVALSPFYNDHFSYSFVSNGMLGWFGLNAQSNFYLGHRFTVGFPRLKAVVEFGKFKFQRLSYQEVAISTLDDTERFANSNYDNTKKLKLGTLFTFPKEQTLCLLYTREKYDLNLNAENAKGIFIEYMNSKRFSVFADVVFGHVVQGQFLLPSYLKEKDFLLPKTAIAFQVGIRKSIFYAKKYYEFTYAEDF